MFTVLAIILTIVSPLVIPVGVTVVHVIAEARRRRQAIADNVVLQSVSR